jgi:hypothetical protein
MPTESTMQALLERLRSACRTYPGCDADCPCGNPTAEYFAAEDVRVMLGLPAALTDWMPAIYHGNDNTHILSRESVLWLAAWPCIGGPSECDCPLAD